MAKSIADWMREGEELYLSAMREYEELEDELSELETRYATKKDEVNQIARIIGKPMIEGNRRVEAELVEDSAALTVSNSSSTIARALTGRNLVR